MPVGSVVSAGSFSRKTVSQVDDENSSGISEGGEAIAANGTDTSTDGGSRVPQVSWIALVIAIGLSATVVSIIFFCYARAKKNNTNRFWALLGRRNNRVSTTSSKLDVRRPSIQSVTPSLSSSALSRTPTLIPPHPRALSEYTQSTTIEVPSGVWQSRDSARFSATRSVRVDASRSTLTTSTSRSRTTLQPIVTSVAGRDAENVNETMQTELTVTVGGSTEQVVTPTSEFGFDTAARMPPAYGEQIMVENTSAERLIPTGTGAPLRPDATIGDTTVQSTASFAATSSTSGTTSLAPVDLLRCGVIDQQTFLFMVEQEHHRRENAKQDRIKALRRRIEQPGLDAETKKRYQELLDELELGGGDEAMSSNMAGLGTGSIEFKLDLLSRKSGAVKF
ncbi:hypothetical protein HK102_006280 [Quaeritorhiza haematococci]|nr:hypothetical protein HK102_006280 [Quaeritorhiza haematococci]